MTINFIRMPLLGLLLFFSLPGFAQSGWESSWDPLYNDNNIQVDVQYYIPAITTCQGTSGKDYKYRYRVKGQYRSSDYFLNWKMNYVDCNGDLNYQQNALSIGKANADDISGGMMVESMEYRFSAASLDSKHYEASAGLTEKRGTGRIPFQTSKDPTGIGGPTKVYLGKTADLTVEGGALGLDADWVWYQDQCNGTRLGKGKSIRIAPTESITVYVRAEGRNNITKCAKITIDVDKSSTAPTSISAKGKICKGEAVTLTVSGGSLGVGAGWVWYENNCGGKSIGTGNSITVRPKEAMNYLVRAEGGLHTTNCASTVISVYDKSTDPVSITTSGKNSICEGESIQLGVKGGKLAIDAVWQWFADQCGNNPITNGDNVTFQPLTTTTYFVRGEGSCNNTICLSTTITVDRRATNPSAIIAPKTVMKGEKVQLVLSGGAAPNDNQWQWYRGSCGSGNYLGSGRTINVHPRKVTTYSIKGVGKCNETNCLSTLITPIKMHSFDKYYFPRRKFLEFGFGLGLEYIEFHELASRTIAGIMDEDNINIKGLGGQGEVIFHPLIKEHFSFGIIAGGALGTTPLVFKDGKETGSSGDEIQEHYFYKRVHLGAELALGFSKVKFLFNLNKTDQFNDYTKTISPNYGTPEENYVFDRELRKESLGGGFRFGRYASKGSFDLLYTLTRNTTNGLTAFTFDHLNTWNSGFGISWWKQSAFKFKFDAVFSSNLSDEKIDFDQTTYQVSLIYNRNWFY